MQCLILKFYKTNPKLFQLDNILYSSGIPTDHIFPLLRLELLRWQKCTSSTCWQGRICSNVDYQPCKTYKSSNSVMHLYENQTLFLQLYFQVNTSNFTHSCGATQGFILLFTYLVVNPKTWNWWSCPLKEIP